MTTDQHLDDDAKTLAEMGYAQELRRGMSAFSNFAISFSIISILAGCITSYRIALISGGPSALTVLADRRGDGAPRPAMAESARLPAGGRALLLGRRLAKPKAQWALSSSVHFRGGRGDRAIDFGCAST